MPWQNKCIYSRVDLRMLRGAHLIITVKYVLFLKPEGVEQHFSETLFLELESLTPSSSRSFSFSSFPANVVPGSQRAYTALVGTSTFVFPVVLVAFLSECSLSYSSKLSNFHLYLQ